MADPSRARRLSTPVVLAAASVMISIGVVAMISSQQGSAPASEGAAPPVVPREVAIDQTSPERAAESWLDAWRTRAHDVGLRLSVGTAREKIALRRTREEAMSPEDRALGEAVWKQLADTRLRLQINESENLEGGRLALRGHGIGEWMGRPYVRRMEFEMEKRGAAWFVAAYRFYENEPDVAGPTATPGILPDGGEDPRTPGHIPTRPPPPAFSEEDAAP
jgi:hypothetical protein